jgi:hypothetical protein
MFTERENSAIAEIDLLVSVHNRKLFKEGGNVFLSWTFSTNHENQLAIFESDFVK